MINARALFRALCVTITVFGSTLWADASATQDRVSAAYMLSLGRLPTVEEAQQWRERDTQSVGELMALLKQVQQADAALQQEVARRAFRDAFGREPAADEAHTPAGSSEGYAVLLQRHLKQLSENAEAYAEVIDRAYLNVIRRKAYPEEHEYWRDSGTMTYVLLVGCVEDWAKRNQPGLMVTSGTPTISINSAFLATQRLSPDIASEAREAIQLRAPSEAGRHVVAPGADELMSAGGIHFALAGGDWSDQ